MKFANTRDKISDIGLPNDGIRYKNKKIILNSNHDKGFQKWDRRQFEDAVISSEVAEKELYPQVVRTNYDKSIFTPGEVAKDATILGLVAIVVATPACAYKVVETKTETIIKEKEISEEELEEKLEQKLEKEGKISIDKKTLEDLQKTGENYKDLQEDQGKLEAFNKNFNEYIPIKYDGKWGMPLDLFKFILENKENYPNFFKALADSPQAQSRKDFNTPEKLAKKLDELVDGVVTEENREAIEKEMANYKIFDVEKKVIGIYNDHCCEKLFAFYVIKMCPNGNEVEEEPFFKLCEFEKCIDDERRYKLFEFDVIKAERDYFMQNPEFANQRMEEVLGDNFIEYKPVGGD